MQFSTKTLHNADLSGQLTVDDRELHKIQIAALPMLPQNLISFPKIVTIWKMSTH